MIHFFKIFLQIIFRVLIFGVHLLKCYCVYQDFDPVLVNSNIETKSFKIIVTEAQFIGYWKCKSWTQCEAAYKDQLAKEKLAKKKLTTKPKKKFLKKQNSEEEI